MPLSLPVLISDLCAKLTTASFNGRIEAAVQACKQVKMSSTSYSSMCSTFKVVVGCSMNLYKYSFPQANYKTLESIFAVRKSRRSLFSMKAYVVTAPPFVLPSCLCFPFFLLVRVNLLF